MSILLRQPAAAQATLDRFIGVPFAWGSFDCAKMVIFHLRQLDISLSIAKAGQYTTALGAARSLRRLGFTTLSQVLDDRGLMRIPPAAHIAGDIVEVPGSEAIGSLFISVGNGRVLGYHESLPGAEVLQPLETLAAWRPLANG